MLNPESDPFKKLSKEAGPVPDVNEPTAALLKKLKDFVYGVTLENQGLKLEDLTIKESYELKEAQELVESLTFTITELSTFLQNGSRQVLLKYFTEDQIESSGFFDSSVLALSVVSELGQSIISSAKMGEPIQLLRLKEFTDSFSAALLVVLESSYSKRNILNEVISNISLEEERNERLKRFDQIREDFLLFHEHFFRLMFIGQADPHSEVGNQFLSEVTNFIPGIIERLTFLQTFSISDMSHLDLDDREKHSLQEKIANRVESVGSYANIFSDASRSDELAHQPMDASDLKWLSNSVRALGESLVELVSDDEFTI